MVLGNSFTAVLFLGVSRNNGNLVVSTKLNSSNLCHIPVYFISGVLIIDLKLLPKASITEVKNWLGLLQLVQLYTWSKISPMVQV